ncbi:MAG TPA: PIN domain-containing protein [Phycisphaerae bacterium]|nr:PIN domain-containing protein [Phycisphaerae bacterium]
MKVYFDICCLKRPFDEQVQPRIVVETAAVLSLLEAASEGKIQPIRSVAHDLENSWNPDAKRAAAVQEWLIQQNPIIKTPSSVRQQTEVFMSHELGEFDAFHLAWAEYHQASVLVTTDDNFIKRAGRLGDTIKVRVMDPISLFRELNP